MPKPIPFPTKPKEMPTGTDEVPNVPTESGQVATVPPESSKITGTPEKTPEVEETPQVSPQKEEMPNETPLKEEKPSDFIDENCVVINGEKIEIKPTKLKYFRNKTASAYNVLKKIPLTELLTIGKGIIDERRDGDQVVYDFLVAAFDNSEFVRDNYDNFDADQIEQVVNIVGRLNHIDEKIEEQRKNREAQGNR